MRLNPLDGMLYLAMRALKALDRRETDLRFLNPGHIRNILVVSSTAIGDTLLSTPAIRAVRERYTKAKIVACFNAKNMELFDNNPHLDGVIPYYGGYKRFFRTIGEFRRGTFDLVLIFHGNEPQATPMAYLSGAPFIVKLPNTSAYRFLLSNRDPVLQWSDFSHAIEQRLGVAALAGCDATGRRMVLPLDQQGESFVHSFLKEKGIADSDILVGFQVGASTVSRMWFPERFIELGRRVIDSDPHVKIVVTGSPRELDYCKGIADEIGQEAVLSAGKIPLRFVPSLITRLKTLVTGDTGIMHIAIAVGTPVIALFAVADSRASGPYYDGEKHTIIQKERTCDPCVGKKCTYQKCMENISVDEVFDAMKSKGVLA